MSSKKKVRGFAYATLLELGVKHAVLTGDFSSWSREGVALERQSDGRWTAQLRLPPGEYQYRLIVDGVWSDDPQAKKRVPGPYGAENCVLVVG